MLLFAQMDLNTFYKQTLEFLGSEQKAETSVEFSTQQKLKTAIRLAENSRDFDDFKKSIGKKIREYIKITEGKKLLAEIKTVIALKQRLV